MIFSKKQNTLSKGFTLLEFMISIAVLAIIFSMLFASFRISRGKSADAVVESTLSGLRSEAEIFYAADKTYTGVCAMTGSNVLGARVLAAANAVGVKTISSNTVAGTISNAVCNDSPDAWAAQVMTSTATGVICADYTGTVVRSTTSLLTTATDYRCL